MEILKNKNKGFTLIELLVVVAIIGILAAVGVVAYSGYTQSAKRNAALAQHKTAIKFIKNSLGMCDIQGGGTLELSNKRSINCNITNNAGGINTMNGIFINHFLDLGWKNPYGETDPVVYTARNGTNDRDVGYHRLRSPGTTIKVWTCVKTPCSGTECSIPNHVCSGDIDISGL